MRRTKALLATSYFYYDLKLMESYARLLEKPTMLSDFTN